MRPFDNNNKIEYLCINRELIKGTLFRNFYTNGKELNEAFLTQKFDKYMLSDLSLVQGFIDNFEEFETSFYRWIDSLEND